MELEEKLFLSQLVIEFLIEDYDAAEYEDLLTKIQAASLTQLPNGGIKFSEDSLLRYAEFVCDRVYHYDDAGHENDQPLILRRCMRTLIQLSGIMLGRKRATRKLNKKRSQNEKSSKAGQTR